MLWKENRFDITFTEHSLKRISDRLCHHRLYKLYIPVNEDMLWMHCNWNYIHPHFMKAIIEDASKMNHFMYCRMDDTVISFWTICTYVFDRWWKMVTVLREVTKEYIDKHKAIEKDKSFLIRFMNSERDNKLFSQVYETIGMP